MVEKNNDLRKDPRKFRRSQTFPIKVNRVIKCFLISSQIEFTQLTKNYTASRLQIKYQIYKALNFLRHFVFGTDFPHGCRRIGSFFP